MTVIWAKVIKWKWTLFADDLITQWNITYSATTHYRMKIRELPRAPRTILVASSWTCRESDLISNLLDKSIFETLNWSNTYTSLQLLDIIQESIVSWVKTLKEVSEDNPEFSLLILDTYTNTVFFVEEFSVKILNDKAECVCWCWQRLFYKLYERYSNLDPDERFRKAIIDTAVLDEWCWVPVFETNWLDYYVYDEDWNITAQKHIEE